MTASTVAIVLMALALACDATSMQHAAHKESSLTAATMEDRDSMASKDQRNTAKKNAARFDWRPWRWWGSSSHTAPRDCSQTEVQSVKSLTSVKESDVGSGSPPFPCVAWYDAAKEGTVKQDTELSPADKDVIQAPSLGGHGYAGDGKYSDNCNNLLSGQQLAEWNQPGVGGWTMYGGAALPWRDQILVFAKKLAAALNLLPNTKQVVYRGSWAKETQMKATKVGDVQKKAGFISCSANKAWAQGFAHDYHMPRTKEDEKAPGHVSVMYTIHTKRAKDIRRLNPRESELILLPNSKFRVISVRREANMPFATFSPNKVAQWLRAFDPPMETSAKHVEKEKIDGNRILASYCVDGFFKAKDLIVGLNNSGTNQDGGYPQPMYTDADGEKKSLYVMLRGPSQGAGKFAGMFKQKYAPLAEAGKANNVFSKVGMFYAVEMEEVTEEDGAMALKGKN